ncbi:MAG: hypothetical protein EOO07_07350 [Chitinophagaceae bacterium]|nr:MAG: hypothetical protein EOO07_07350 [Chitinophagaceae bacterium]
MENKDIKPQPSNSDSHPKPTDNAQALVETIIPSTEEKAGTTTKIEPTDTKTDTADENKEQEEVSSSKADEQTSAKDDEAKNNDESDEIETVAP